MARLVVIDANNLVHRAYHALPPLTTSSGVPVNAVLGLLNMLLKIREDLAPDYLVCVFDAPTPEFRTSIFPEYKAHRPEPDEDLVTQMPIVEEMLRAFGIPQVLVEGYEADDVIGALVAKAREQQLETVIVSNDRDLFQLVGGEVRILATGRSLSQTVLYDSEGVRERFGVSPEQMVDYKALVGDPSDNLPGIPGIGEKTAVKLLEQFGSLEGIAENLDRVEPPRLRERIRQHLDLARKCAAVTRLKTDAPLPETMEPFRYAPPPLERVRPVLEKYEFSSLLKRLESRLEPQAATPPAATYKHAPAEAPRIPCAFYLHQSKGRVPALAVVSNSESHLVPLSGGSGQADLFGAGQEPAALPAAVSNLLLNEQLPKTTHDYKTIYRRLQPLGCAPAGVVFDTFLASYLLDPTRQEHPVERLASTYLRRKIPEPTEDEHGVQAALAVRDLQGPLSEALREAGMLSLLTKLELPLSPVLAEMEKAGVAVDVAGLERLSERLAEQEKRHEARVHELAGETFNVASPKQLQHILFEKLGLPKTRRTKTGLSTDEDALVALREKHPIIDEILAHRTVSKLRSTYADALRRYVNPLTGRIHTTFNQAGAATGRISSSEPNLQNVPIRGEWGTDFRRCFIAGSQDNVLLSADYSQIELRILAHLSKEPMLVSAFLEDRDIHTQTAATIFEIKPEQVTAEKRRQAKTVNFGILYGMGARALARDLGVSQSHAQHFITEYLSKLPRVRDYIEQAKQQARELGFVVTLLGRRRPMPEVRSPRPQIRAFGERAAVNAPLQGSAADIIKLAMVEISRSLLPKFPEAQMLLQIHDELLFEMPRSQVPDFVPPLRRIMESAMRLDVPLKADIRFGPNWADMEPV